MIDPITAALWAAHHDLGGLPTGGDRMTTRRSRAADTQRPEIVCEDCGREWACRSCRPRRNPYTGRYQKIHPDPFGMGGPHDSAARVQGWTVWRERDGLGRTTILCPKHRRERGIQARVRLLEDAS